MTHRVVSWVLLIWTVLMGLGIFAAYLGIGGGCAGLAGSTFDACRSDALARGFVGLLLLGLLWLVVAAPFAYIWLRGRTAAR